MNNDVTASGISTFCNLLTVESAIKCDASHKMAAKCDLVDYESYDQSPLYPYSASPSAPSAEYQYFTTKASNYLVGRVLHFFSLFTILLTLLFENCELELGLFSTLRC